MKKISDSSDDVSVVIATLGGDTLLSTIESINSSSIVPVELLICIPSDNANNVAHLKHKNLKIVKTDCRGQVAQRAVGFAIAKSPYVLQIDDDIELDYLCIEELFNIVSSSSDISAGPMLYDKKTGMYHSHLAPSNQRFKYLDKLIYVVANGKQGYTPGKIAKSGINFGLPEKPGTWSNIDWLSGGCILHHKENLVLSNFYPVKGKAYAEDLFHSKLLREKNVVLVRSGKAKCNVDFSSSKGALSSFFRGYLQYLIPMRIFVKSINGSMIRLYLFLILNSFSILLIKKFK